MSKSKAKMYRIAGILSAVIAAGLGATYLYHAGKTEMVVVAATTIEPNTYVTASDFTTKPVHVADVLPDTAPASAESVMLNHRINVEVLPGEQIESSMFGTDTSLQQTVNDSNDPNIVTFYMPYKAGTTTQTVQPNTIVEMMAPGPNSTLIDDHYVKVLSNSGYVPYVGASSTKGTSSSPVLCLQMDRTKYQAMYNSIISGNVQILLIPQSTVNDSVDTSASVGSNASQSVTNSQENSNMQNSSSDNSTTNMGQSDNAQVQTNSTTPPVQQAQTSPSPSKPLKGGTGGGK
ncbi:SAF domain-containing protein [Alicyclobacillus fodiniaquatilis]|uniref:SAF domain-containing protein n=1 Tax=Alicyclobacillus fodiniaquatilis TaxID=1661150 RepID=A0ABW4JJR5_9BACL